MLKLFLSLIHLLWIIATFPDHVRGATIRSETTADTHSFQKLSPKSTFDVDENLELFLQHQRRLELSEVACDEVIFEWSLQETRENSMAYLMRITGASSEQAQAKVATFPYGIRAQKVCAKCSDFPDALPGNTTVPFCHTADYGSDAVHSGLLFLPLSTSTLESTTIAPGTNVVHVACRGTRTDTYPSLEATAPLEDLLLNDEVFTPILITAGKGAFSVLPDFMGYGESQAANVRAPWIQMAYMTSAVPLVLRARQIVEVVETDCESILTSAAVVVGYDEGANAAVAVSRGLKEIGFKIIGVLAGGGSYKVGSTLFLNMIERMDSGTYPALYNYYMMVLGSPFSSTYQGLENSDLEQFLAPEYRDEVVMLFNNGTNFTELNDYISTTTSAAEGDGNPLNLMNPDFLAFIRNAIANNDINPCKSQIADSNSQHFALCKALYYQDLNDYLLSVDYRVEFCLSPVDEIASFGNIPNITLNSKYLSMVMSFSHTSHQRAGAFCTFRTFQFYDSLKLGGYKIPKEKNCLHLPPCGKKNAACTTTSDCCDAGIKAKCFTIKIEGICDKCKKKGKKCKTGSDCCSEICNSSKKRRASKCA